MRIARHSVERRGRSSSRLLHPYRFKHLENFSKKKLYLVSTCRFKICIKVSKASQKVTDIKGHIPCTIPHRVHYLGGDTHLSRDTTLSSSTIISLENGLLQLEKQKMRLFSQNRFKSYHWAASSMEEFRTITPVARTGPYEKNVKYQTCTQLIYIPGPPCIENCSPAPKPGEGIRHDKPSCNETFACGI